MEGGEKVVVKRVSTVNWIFNFSLRKGEKNA